MEMKFEFVGEDKDYPGSKIYSIKAITVTTTRNNRKYNENEMRLGARSLSFRPLDRNHEMDKTLPYPASQTLIMDYNSESMAVEGKMRIADPDVISLIDSGKINKLSIEQIPYKGESCSTTTGVCEQNGVVFTGLALLDYDVMPGDKNTQIKAESVQDIPLYEMIDLPRCSCCKEDGTELSPSSADRPDSHFAYVPKGKNANKSDRKLPIYDAPHVRNALARFSQTDLPANAKAAVFQKIKKAAKKHGIQVSEEQRNYASTPFGGYDDLDDCVSDNNDQDDPYGYCTRLQTRTQAITGMGMQIPTPNKRAGEYYLAVKHNSESCDTCKSIREGWKKYKESLAKKDEEGAETGDSADKGGKGLTIDDVRNYWNSLNDSQRAHVVDPNDHYPNTKLFSKKKWDDLTQDQQTAMLKTFGFRHSWNDVKKLLPKDQQDPDTEGPVLDNDLMGDDKTEKDLKDAEKKLQAAGIKDPMAQSMAAQDPKNKTEKSSLNSESQTNHIMTGSPNQDIKAKNHSKEWIESLKNMMLNSKWSTDKLEAFRKIMASGEKKNEIDSMISAFIGMQNDKAPLSDKLADVLYNASDDELDQYARVTMDQQPSVIPTGGLPDYKAFTQELAKVFSEVMKTSQSETMKALETMNQKWIETVKPKQEAVPSSQVDDSQAKVKAEKVKKMYEMFDIKGFPGIASGVPFNYSLDKNEYLFKYGGSIKSGAMDLSNDTLKRFDQSATKSETVTVTAGDMGQTFAKQVMLLPGGRMRVPVRQYCNFTEIPNGADRANWYTIGSFVFGAVTEGTEPSNVSQTVTKKQALPALNGAVQRIGYTQIENAPFGLVDAVNNAMVLAGLHDEASDLLGSSGSYWGTPSNVTNWVNGNSGANIVSQDDDIASMTLSRTGLIAAKRLIAAQGYDTSPGNLVLFCHPKAYQDLMLDTNLNTYYQYARPDITTTYVLEQLYGIDIVPTTAVAAATNTTNATYRNTLAVKGWALGMSAAREITIEVQRRNEVQQLIVSGMHRVKSVVIDYAASCGISSAQ